MKSATTRQAKLKSGERANAIVAEMVRRVDVDRRFGRRDEVNFDLLLVDAVAGTERGSAADGAETCEERDEEKRETVDVRGALHDDVDCRRETALVWKLGSESKSSV